MHDEARDVCKRYSEICLVVMRAFSSNIDERSQGVDDDDDVNV